MNTTTERFSYSEVRDVHGRRYRWNLTLDRLEVYVWDQAYWMDSAFSPLVRDSIRTGKLVTLHPSEEPRVEALVDAFALDLNPHHAIGADALAEMPVRPGSNQLHLVPCTVVARSSALDRNYRLIIRLKDSGRALGPCAPECIFPPDHPRK